MMHFPLARQIALGPILMSPIVAQGAPAFGTAMHDDISAACPEANAAGGVGGLILALDRLVHGHEPDQSVTPLKKVPADTRHFALIGPLGTPTNRTMATNDLAGMTLALSQT